MNKYSPEELQYYQKRYGVLVNQLIRLRKLQETNQRAGAKLYRDMIAQPSGIELKQAYQYSRDIRNRIFCLKADTYILYVTTACLKDEYGLYINQADYKLYREQYIKNGHPVLI